MSMYSVGEKVFVDSYEGFGGEGTVTEVLPPTGPVQRYRVDLPSAGWAEPNICFEYELSKRSEENPTAKEADSNADPN